MEICKNKDSGKFSFLFMIPDRMKHYSLLQVVKLDQLKKIFSMNQRKEMKALLSLKISFQRNKSKDMHNMKKIDQRKSWITVDICLNK